MSKSQIPFKNICDAIFKPDLLPAVYRWISALSPEELARFNTVFPRLVSTDKKTKGTTKSLCNRLQPSRYTMPEWNVLPPPSAPVPRKLTTESLLARSTSSHLTYGAFDDDQMRASRAIPTRTRDNDKSQINTTEQSEAYISCWSDRTMNTTYRHDICHSGFNRTLLDQTTDQVVIVYSKATLNSAATEKAKEFVDKDPLWTRNFRELCRSLADSVDATAYRECFTTLKKGPSERFVHPKWMDPVPVSVGLKKSADAYWQTTHRMDFVPSVKTEETFKAVDQHRACYSRPFDLTPMTEKISTTFRVEYQDHMANKEDHPDYWTDMVVRIPPGSGVVGDVVGDKPQP
jgi:hypothetical protein